MAQSFNQNPNLEPLGTGTLRRSAATATIRNQMLQQLLEEEAGGGLGIDPTALTPQTPQIPEQGFFDPFIQWLMYMYQRLPSRNAFFDVVTPDFLEEMFGFNFRNRRQNNNQNNNQRGTR